MQESSMDAEQHQLHQIQPQGLHILLVDDERLSRVVVANLLRKFNHKVTVAESGGQAMQILQQQAPGTFQLVLTDVMMPQVDGIELLRYVRSHSELGDLPVVMMSASEHAETVCECIRGGAQEYLVKPVTQKEIQKIWTHVMRRSSSGAHLNRNGVTRSHSNGKQGTPMIAEQEVMQAANSPPEPGTDLQATQPIELPPPDRPPALPAGLPRNHVTFAVGMQGNGVVQAAAHHHSSQLTQPHMPVDQGYHTAQSGLQLQPPVTTPVADNLQRRMTASARKHGSPTTSHSDHGTRTKATAQKASSLGPNGGIHKRIGESKVSHASYASKSGRSTGQTDKGIQLDLNELVLADFLRLMHNRKSSEVASIDASLSALDADIAALERVLDGRRKAAKRCSQHASQQMNGAGMARANSLHASHATACQMHGQPYSSAIYGTTSQQTPRIDTSGGHKKADVLANTHAESHTQHTQHMRPCSPTSSRGRANSTAAGSNIEEEAMKVAQMQWQRMCDNHTALQDLYLARRKEAMKQTARHVVDATTLSKAVDKQAVMVCSSNEAVSVQRNHATNCQESQQMMMECSSACTDPDVVEQVVPLCGSNLAMPRHDSWPSLPGYMSAFSEDLSGYCQFSSLKLRASIQHGDALSSSQMVCSIAFDRDDEFFATAGVSKRIRVYELSSVMRDGEMSAAFPVLELSSRSRLSSVCWSSYIKPHLAAADYEGVVALWDVNNNVELMQFEEHGKRVWAVDLSRKDPTRLASASDDGTVRIWQINQESSVATLNCQANVCSVQWNPERSHLLAIGTANCRASVYDMRQLSQPLHTISNHCKAVSYVRHTFDGQLLTASTDNTIRRWDLSGCLQENDNHLGGGNGTGIDPMNEKGVRIRSASPDPTASQCKMVYQGHVNERNFVGLSVSPDGYIACGSEDNAAVCYYQALPLPALKHCFSSGGSSRDYTAQSNGPKGFVSSVCWAQSTGLLLAANSLGIIRVLELS